MPDHSPDVPELILQEWIEGSESDIYFLPPVPRRGRRHSELLYRAQAPLLASSNWKYGQLHIGA